MINAILQPTKGYHVMLFDKVWRISARSSLACGRGPKINNPSFPLMIRCKLKTIWYIL